MSAQQTQHHSRARRLLDRFAGGPPRPLGRWGKAGAVFVFFLTPVLVYGAFEARQPILWKVFVLCCVMGGVAGALSRWLFGQRRLAYGLRAAGVLLFLAGVVAFMTHLGAEGEWRFFGYTVIVYGAVLLLVGAGMFYPRSGSQNEPPDETR